MRAHTLTRAVSAALVLSSSAAPAASQAVPTVAVLDFNAFSVSLEDASAMGKGIAAMLTSELSERPQVRIVDRQQIEEVLKRQELGVAVGSAVSDEVAVRAGRLLGADYVVSGSVAVDSRNARIDLRLIDVETSAIERTAKTSGKRDDLLSMVGRVADDFTKDLRVHERPAVIAVEIPARSALAYSRGLDYEKRGEKSRAADMYRQAIQLFPQHPDAQQALHRVGGS